MSIKTIESAGILALVFGIAKGILRVVSFGILFGEMYAKQEYLIAEDEYMAKAAERKAKARASLDEAAKFFD